MSIAAVEYKHIFGLKPAIGIHFLDDQTVIYPAGSNLVFYSHETKSQRFIHLSEHCDKITSVALSTNRRWLAIAETGKKPQIVIYELTTFRKRKVLQLPENSEYISLCFSSDAKYLLSLSGQPDWALTFWSWEKNKVLATVRATNTTDKIANSVFKEQKESLLGQIVYQWYCCLDLVYLTPLTQQ
jgi:cilia- and flagella-associated protein 57